MVTKGYPPSGGAIWQLRRVLNRKCTPLILGVDRDSEELSSLSDERNDAVKIAVRELIEKAHRHQCKVGLCGQAPSDHPAFAQFLVHAGIDSISLNPDRVIDDIEMVTEVEGERAGTGTGTGTGTG